MSDETVVEARDFLDSDFPSLQELWLATGVGNPARGDTLESLHRSFAMGGRLPVLVAGGRIVGSLWMTDDGRRLYLHHMAVLPEFQGRRLSLRLMETARATARERRLQMKLEVHEGNARAISLYLKYGFAPLEGYATMIRRSID